MTRSSRVVRCRATPCHPVPCHPVPSGASAVPSVPCGNATRPGPGRANQIRAVSCPKGRLPSLSAGDRPGVLAGEEGGEIALAVLLDGGVELVGHEGVVDGAVDVAEDADGG